VQRHVHERQEWQPKGMGIEQQLPSVDIQLTLPGLARLARLGRVFRLAKMTDRNRMMYPRIRRHVPVLWRKVRRNGFLGGGRGRGCLWRLPSSCSSRLPVSQIPPHPARMFW
jgi:hypothetical protein